MTSKRRQMSYLYISNGEGPAPDMEQIDKAGRAMGKTILISPTKEREYNTITCSHCQQTFLFNGFRQRERQWCWSCDHYICDRCGAIRKVVGCKTFASIMASNSTLGN